MPLLPGDPVSLIGLGLTAATIAVLLISDWPRAHVLSAALLVFFGVQFVDQWLTGARVGMDELALSTRGLVNGDWWSPLTYMFLHAGFLHIFGNLWILATAGPMLEDSVGPNAFLAIYALGGLAAALAGVALSLTTGIVSTGSLMVGASGAIFGVLTAFAVRHPKEKLPFILIFLVVWLPSMTVLLIYLALNLAYIFTDTTIAWYGHFAGFLVGLIAASSGRLKPAEGQEPG
ncbi:MAG: rhomboid family intramembrane serine protease, partial [Candidatus Thermoplasmatota archaeon]|nr:rhomboid family intramembrane serine protease [Candidatus Thermoplasmatota archaeon]